MPDLRMEKQSEAILDLQNLSDSWCGIIEEDDYEN